jgi:hypothetical protein
VSWISRPILEQKSAWRKTITTKFPDDPRNKRASDRLDQLAIEAAEMTDGQYDLLKPFCGWVSVTFRDAASQVARQVGFYHRAKDFSAFVAALVHELSQSSSVAA